MDDTESDIKPINKVNDVSGINIFNEPATNLCFPSKPNYHRPITQHDIYVGQKAEEVSNVN